MPKIATSTTISTTTTTTTIYSALTGYPKNEL